jgi:hypothetical protein
MKRFLKTLFSTNAISCFCGLGILGGALFGFTSAIVGGLAGAAFGAWSASKREKAERR